MKIPAENNIAILRVLRDDTVPKLAERLHDTTREMDSGMAVAYSCNAVEGPLQYLKGNIHL